MVGLRDPQVFYNNISIANYAVSAIGSATQTTWSATTVFIPLSVISPTETNVQTLARGTATLMKDLKDRGLI